MYYELTWIHLLCIRKRLTTLSRNLICASLFPLRWGGKKPSEVHPHWHRGFTADLLHGLLCRVGFTHAHDALLPARSPKPATGSFPVHWLGSCQIRSGCWFALRPVYQVRRHQEKMEVTPLFVSVSSHICLLHVKHGFCHWKWKLMYKIIKNKHMIWIIIITDCY